ncbi:MAG: hypothetical protein LBN42_01795 [Oscillospiraceae bacterium]|jgi:hypothetical protein|nr:hypothetical protein [Oscillospiraceae bacterium]
MSTIAVAAVTKPRRTKSINNIGNANANANTNANTNANANTKKERPLTPREQRVLEAFGKIPEDIDDPFYDESNVNYLLTLMADIKSGKVKTSYHDIIELDEEIDDVDVWW